MAKQAKVLNKIKHSIESGQDNANLGVKNNDECYTSMKTILDELSHWGDLGKFRGKKIICPCDWDIVEGSDIYSITIEYEPEFKATQNSVFEGTKVQLGLFDHLFEEKTILKTIDLKEDEVEDFLRNKLTCNFIRTFTQMARVWGIKSITASGYNPEVGKGIPFQDVDYSKYDVCVTNPPFSIYKEFMASILGKIDFVILAPFLNRGAPCCGVPLMLGQAYLGFGVHLNAEFQNPTKDNKFKIKHVNCDWITSWPEAQEERNNRHFKSGVKYEDYKGEWPEMPNMTMKDGTHPIRVSMSTYPEDYDGWMFATLGILDNLDLSEYDFAITGCKGYFNAHMDINPFNHKLSNAPMLTQSNGKVAFHGIVFRRKQ